MSFSFLKIISILLLVFSINLFSVEETKDLLKPKSNFVYAGYSALLPGLGQIKKDRLYTGIFMSTVFGLGVLNIINSIKLLHEEQAIYNRNSALISFILLSNQSTLSSNSSLNLFLASSASPFQQIIYKDYESAALRGNQSFQFLFVFYLFQIGHAFFAEPGTALSSKFENSNSKKTGLSFNLSPSKNQLGQAGVNMEINYNWSF